MMIVIKTGVADERLQVQESLSLGLQSSEGLMVCKKGEPLVIEVHVKLSHIEDNSEGLLVNLTVVLLSGIQ